MKGNLIYVVGAGLLLVVALFAWGKMSKSTDVAVWPGSTVHCLVGGEVNLAVHVHPLLTVSVNGEPELIPANTGITTPCFSELHTHDTTGVIHVESQSGDRHYTLADFLAVYGKPFQREGMNVSLMVDGKSVASPSEVPLLDKEQISLIYTSGNATSATSTGTPTTS